MQSAVGGIVSASAILMFSALAIATVALGEESLAASPPMLIQASALAGESAAATRLEAGVRGELLMQHGRLLPNKLSIEETTRLAVALQDRDPSHESSLQQLFSTFPKADDLVFDGQHYAGGNLDYIDSLLGKSGRPIAFDRELPALLVPLAADADAIVAEKRSAFQADAETLKVREAADETLGAGTGALMFADGQFLREYVGRFDDLYLHLFQKGNGANALAFCGLADGLSGRVYQPVYGIRRQDGAPAGKFDVDDILSDGGKSAVRRYLNAQPGRGGEPFKRFAFRVLPSVVGKTQTLPAGERFTATAADILHALRSRQHFYPTQVPPIYKSADHFLGWAGSFVIRVANKVVLPPGAAESWYPLPEREGHMPASQLPDDKASAQLFESESAPEVWEDPQLSTLLADPENGTEAQEASPPNKPATPAPASRAESDPRRRVAKTRLVAVVTPTAQAAQEYRVAIAASDDELRAIERKRGRLHLLRRFIESARAASAGTELDPSIASLERAMAADLVSFGEREAELSSMLQAALQKRADVRSQLESRLQREQVEPLQILGKKDGETEAPQGVRLILNRPVPHAESDASGRPIVWLATPQAGSGRG